MPDSGSEMFEVLKEINRLFGEEAIKIIARRMEALGSNIYFQQDSPLLTRYKQFYHRVRLAGMGISDSTGRRYRVYPLFC